MRIRPRAKEWRPIPGFPNYEVSDVGHVRRVSRGPGTWVGKILHPWVDAGYLRYDLCQNGEQEGICEHILVALAFHGPKPTPEHEVAHWDGRKQNNDYRNLRWATRAENYADTVRHGRAYTPTDEQMRELGRRALARRRMSSPLQQEKD